MSTVQKLLLVIIGVITAIFSALLGFLMGDLTLLPLAIGTLPLVLGRIFFGASVLDYLEEIYSVSILLQILVHLPAEIYPEAYLDIFTGLVSMFYGSTDGAIMANLDAALTYEAVLGSVFVLILVYAYREGYFGKAVDKLYQT